MRFARQSRGLSLRSTAPVENAARLQAAKPLQRGLVTKETPLITVRMSAQASPNVPSAAHVARDPNGREGLLGVPVTYSTRRERVHRGSRGRQASLSGLGDGRVAAVQQQKSPDEEERRRRLLLRASGSDEAMSRGQAAVALFHGHVVLGLRLMISRSGAHTLSVFRYGRSDAGRETRGQLTALNI